MAGYIEQFLVPIQKRKLNEYKKLARIFAKVVKDRDVLFYVECVNDDVPPNFLKAFGKSVSLKQGEVLIASVVGYRNKKHRDETNKFIMSDPRIAAAMKTKPPFDMKRMVYGGFKTIVKL